MAEEKTVISIKDPTPKWATIVFRTVINLTFGAVIWIGGTNLISNATKVELLLAMKVIDHLAWGGARMLGIKKDAENEEEDAKN